MSPNPAYINISYGKLNNYNQSVTVSSYIEYIMLVTDIVGSRKINFYI